MSLSQTLNQFAQNLGRYHASRFHAIRVQQQSHLLTLIVMPIPTT